MFEGQSTSRNMFLDLTEVVILAGQNAENEFAGTVDTFTYLFLGHSQVTQTAGQEEEYEFSRPAIRGNITFSTFPFWEIAFCSCEEYEYDPLHIAFVPSLKSVFCRPVGRKSG